MLRQHPHTERRGIHVHVNNERGKGLGRLYASDEDTDKCTQA